MVLKIVAVKKVIHLKDQRAVCVDEVGLPVHLHLRRKRCFHGGYKIRCGDDKACGDENAVSYPRIYPAKPIAHRREFQRDVYEERQVDEEYKVPPAQGNGVFPEEGERFSQQRDGEPYREVIAVVHEIGIVNEDIQQLGDVKKDEPEDPFSLKQKEINNDKPGRYAYQGEYVVER